MNSKRTPDEAFENLSNYAFAPHYLEDLSGFTGLRLHYLDEGERHARQTFLCLHGQPTWSYLYRKMIPVFSSAGHRVIAPDLFGFGRSDKPVAESDYTFDFHRQSLLRLIEKLDLQNITLVCQDWGGLLGLTIPMSMPERFSRLLVMNTTLAVGKAPTIASGLAFQAWRTFNKLNPDLAISKLVRGSEPYISLEEAKGYDAPFPDQSYKAGVRIFPELVPSRPDAPEAALARAAKQWWANEWTGQSFMAVGMKDLILGAAVMQDLRKTIRNCPTPLEIRQAGHFVQESGKEIALAALQAFAQI